MKTDAVCDCNIAIKDIIEYIKHCYMSNKVKLNLMLLTNLITILPFGCATLIKKLSLLYIKWQYSEKVHMTAATRCVTHVLVLLLSCCHYTDDHHWLLNWSYIDKYFDSESYWLYIEIKKVFFSVQFTSILTVYLHAGHKFKENQLQINLLFLRTNLLKNEWRNSLFNSSIV